MLSLPDQEIFEQLEIAATALEEARVATSGMRSSGSLGRRLSRSAARARDLGTIFQRLVEGSTELARQRALPRVPMAELSHDRVMRLRRLSEMLELDRECLLNFGASALDDWARASAYLAGVEEPRQFAFEALVEALDSGDVPSALAPVRMRLLRHARWLHFWLWTYQGSGVAPRRATRRGSSSAVGNDNDCAYPSKLRARLTKVVDNIGAIERSIDRQRFANLAGVARLQGPEFRVIASVLADFISRGTSLVLGVALAHSKIVRLEQVRRELAARNLK